MSVSLTSWLRCLPPPTAQTVEATAHALSLALVPVWSRQTQAARTRLNQATHNVRASYGPARCTAPGSPAPKSQPPSAR